VKGTSYNVRAREAEGEEREQLWRKVTDRVPAYNQYQARTSRRIPVVVLEPQ
jgi:proline iminopeptidase